MTDFVTMNVNYISVPNASGNTNIEDKPLKFVELVGIFLFVKRNYMNGFYIGLNT